MSVYHNIYNDSKNYSEKIEEIKGNACKNNFLVWSQFLNCALSTFRWKNLPESILSYMPEEQLVYFGQNAFFMDDDGKFKIYPAYMSGELLENGLYSKYYMIAKNGKVWERDYKDIELCFSNSSRIPPIMWINEIADKTTLALSSVDICLERITMPTVYGAGDSEIDAKKIEGLYSDVKNKLPVRITTSDYISKLKDNKITLYDAREVPLNDLWSSYIRYRNMFYSLYGVDNVEQEKQERLTFKESASNDEITRHTLITDMYNQRLDFCERVKNHFGYEMNVILDRNFVKENGEIIRNEKIEYASMSYGKNEEGGENNDAENENN